MTDRLTPYEFAASATSCPLQSASSRDLPRDYTAGPGKVLSFQSAADRYRISIPLVKTTPGGYRACLDCGGLAWFVKVDSEGSVAIKCAACHPDPRRA